MPALGSRRGRALEYAAGAVVLVACYLVLDWASYIAPLGRFNITPWNPQPGLAIAWMTILGLHYAPVVWMAIVIADVLVREVPGGLGVMISSAAVLAVGYAGIVTVLRARLNEPLLSSTRSLTLFTVVLVAGTALTGAGFVGALALGGVLPLKDLTDAWVRFWVGDAVGALVTGPLVFAIAGPRLRNEFATFVHRREAWVQLGVLGLGLWVVFAGLEGNPLWHFYLLFLPLIWMAVSNGLAGALVATAVVQVGVIVAIHRQGGAVVPVWELQALVAALTLTGLYLGTLEHERQVAARDLSQSLRLAAAGEMSGAVAHELNQPLTALSNYGQSALLLARRPALDIVQLEAVIGRMLAEAHRAADVVRRLRDFFRTGTTRLEPLTASEVVEAAERIARHEIGTRVIGLDVTAETGLPVVLADRLQIELVLRNLLANAVDAVVGSRQEDGRIRVSVERADAEHIRVVVADNGPGLTGTARARLFEPFTSDKASGMGLGLAVSRAIAVAHGGRLQARPAAHGEFHLELPCSPT